MIQAELPLFPAGAGRQPDDDNLAAVSVSRSPPPRSLRLTRRPDRRRDRESAKHADKLCSRVATLAMLQRLLAAGEVKTDDLRHLPTTAGKSRKYLGCIGPGLAKLGIVECGEYVPSRDALNHGHPIRRWVLIYRAEAVRLLGELRADIQESGAGSSPVD